jgi:hypothetical protein
MFMIYDFMETRIKAFPAPNLRCDAAFPCKFVCILMETRIKAFPAPNLRCDAAFLLQIRAHLQRFFFL